VKIADLRVPKLKGKKVAAVSPSANENGGVALEPPGGIAAVGWTVGLEETFEWDDTPR
jgi:hypothetical protein